MTTPGQGASGILRQLAGAGGAASQFFMWGVLYGLTQQAMGPTFQEVANKVNASNPTVPLSPSEAATAVLKGQLSAENGAKEAAMGGVDSGRFATLERMAGGPPGLAELLSLFRRGELTEDLLHQAVRQSDIKNEWFENGTIQKLGKVPPSPVDFLQAYLEGQLSESDAKQLYQIYGGIMSHGKFNIFDIMFNTRGTAPTPSEALELMNRGIISQRGKGPKSTSYEQAFLEGPWRNKWLEPFLALARYLPPPRSVTTLISHGSITDARALELFMENGLNKEDAAAYVKDAHSAATSRQRELAVSEIETLYFDQAISRNEASGFLENLGFSSGDASFILLIQDLRRERKFLESAISRIKTLFVDHKISNNQVTSSLAKLKVPTSQITNLLATWTLERAANVPKLTESQVAAAFYYGAMTQPEAIDKLEQMGYSPFDSWVILSNRAHGPLQNKPAIDAKNPYYG